MIKSKGTYVCKPENCSIQQRHLPIYRKSHFFWRFQESRLKAEISEYVVTENIEQQFGTLGSNAARYGKR
jgi:hypothetical protein